MISHDCSIFVVQNRFDNVINRVNNQTRQQQFAILMNFYEIIILSFHFANSTKSTFKRLLNDVIDIVNNDVASKRRRERSLKSKNDQRVFSVNVVVFYIFIFLEFVIVRSRQKIRRFERLASRVFFVSQFLFQKDNDNDDFDLFFARFYIDFYDHDFDFDFDDETKIFHHHNKRRNDRHNVNEITTYANQREKSNQMIEFELVFENQNRKIRVTT